MKGADILSALSRRGLFRIKPGLDRMRAAMSDLGNPQDSYPSIHIAGTNGKGSVAAALESMLRSAGNKTGLYLSPHLMDLRERIQICGVPIEPRDFGTAAEAVFEAEQHMGIRLTYFEFLTAMAFVAFREAAVDIAVVEVGLGGLWDATNVLKSPLLSIITSIGTDHRQWLGRTREAIAIQKAGIIKPSGIVISGVKGAPGRTIAAVAKRQDAVLRQLGKDFHAQRMSSAWLDGQQSGLYRNDSGKTLEFTFGLVGKHQIDNAALAIEALWQIRKKRWFITEEHMQKGLNGVQWLGRFFLDRQQEPAILFDGAHNCEAMQVFLATLRESPWRRTPKTLLFSAYADKDYREMARALKEIPQRIIVCRLPGRRGLAASKLAKAFEGTKAPIKVVLSPQAALRYATASTPKNHLIVVTGSLALVGMLLKERRVVQNPIPHEVMRELAYV